MPISNPGSAGAVSGLGTASELNAPSAGDAGPVEVVLGNDSRLENAKIYRAILSTQLPGGVDPVVTLNPPVVLKNTLGGEPAFERTSITTFSITLPGAFPAGALFAPIIFQSGDVGALLRFTFERVSDNELTMTVEDIFQSIPLNGGFMFTDTPIEIFVYSG
jgi:hypothetical protein